MMAVTRCEKELSSVLSVACGVGESSQQAVWCVRQTTSHLSASQLRIARKVENVEDQLWDRVSTDPKEHILPIFDEEETMPFEALASGIECWRQNDTMLSNRPAL